MTEKGLNLIREFESFFEEAYLDIANIPTIGWGTTEICGYPITLGMRINRAVGDLLLTIDITSIEEEVHNLVKVNLNCYQFDALISFQYNLGGLANSTLLRYINQGQKITEKLFTMWNKAHVNGVLTTVAGLTRRRKAEFALYEYKDI
jgi:lysozyme